jgi:hypothetical protein
MWTIRLPAVILITACACVGCGDDGDSSLSSANYSLELSWSDRSDSAVPYKVVAADGVAVVSGRISQAEYDDYLVRVYDGAAGTVRWQDRPDAGCNSGAGDMVVHDGLLFVAGNLCSRYVLRAYELQTGGVVWEHQGSTEDQSSAGNLVIGGNVLVFFGAEAGVAFIRAYSPSSGELLWEQLSEGVSVSGRGDSTTLVTSHFIRELNTYHYVFRAYEIASGEPLWELTEIHEEPIGAPYETAVGEGLFVSYVETRDEPHTWWLTAVSLSTGEVTWQRSVFEHRGFDELLIASDCVHTVGVQGVYDPNSDVWRNALYVSCIDTLSGSSLWEDQRGGMSGDLEGRFGARDGRTLAIVGFEMELWVYDAVTGELAFESLEPVDGRGGPVAIDGDRIYVVGEVFADEQNPSNGALIRAYRESHPVLASAASPSVTRATSRKY